MLFALYMAGLGNALHDSKLGIKLGDVIITALFFADDLVLIASNPKRGMDKLLKIVTTFCRDMKMKLLVPKTYILTNAQRDVSWEVEEATFEEILAAKYLGVTVQIRGRNIVGPYEKEMRKRATSYTHTIMNLTRAGLDRALLARKLWEACAIRAILYCVEAMNVTKTTVAELDRVQNMVGSFILQVPSATSRVFAWMDA